MPVLDATADVSSLILSFNLLRTKFLKNQQAFVEADLFASVSLNIENSYNKRDHSRDLLKRTASACVWVDAGVGIDAGISGSVGPLHDEDVIPLTSLTAQLFMVRGFFFSSTVVSKILKCLVVLLSNASILGGLRKDKNLKHSMKRSNVLICNAPLPQKLPLASKV